MRQYPKIETLFQRDENHKVTDVLKNPILADIDPWVVTEKIDGMNIRIGYRRGDPVPTIAGRTDNAAIPGDLSKWIYVNLPSAKMDTLLKEDSDAQTQIVLFGEGYGAGIQKGGCYRPDKSFILFDVLIDVGPHGAFWMPPAEVEQVAAKLGIDHVAHLGNMSLPEIVDFVRAGFHSRIGGEPAEGIVARPRAVLYDARGNRIILKLKTRDFS